MNVGLSIHRNAVRTPKAPAIFGSGAKNYEQLDVKIDYLSTLEKEYENNMWKASALHSGMTVEEYKIKMNCHD